MKYLGIFPALLFVVMAGCAQQSTQSPSHRDVDLAAEEAAIRAADAQWLAAAKARDREKTISFWTDDASIMMPGASPVTGKQAIKAYVGGSFTSPDFSISWATNKVVVDPSGTMAYSTGIDQVTFKGPDDKLVTAKNNGVAIWRKQPDGSWKVAIDIATPEAIQGAGAASMSTR